MSATISLEIASEKQPILRVTVMFNNAHVCHIECRYLTDSLKTEA